MMGSIPIIQHSTLDDAYQHLPVAYVDSWEQLLKPDNDTAMRELLQGWIRALQPFYLEGSALRKRTMDVRTALFISLSVCFNIQLCYASACLSYIMLWLWY